jgi:hypothetical protein
VIGWIQHVVFDVPLFDVAVRPIVVFGYNGTILVTVGIGILSFILVHFAFQRLLGKEEGVEEPEAPAEEEEEELEGEVEEDTEEAEEEPTGEDEAPEESEKEDTEEE